MISFPRSSGRQPVDGQSHHLSKFLVQRRALAHGGSKINPPQKQRARGPFTSDKDDLQVASKPWFKRAQAQRIIIEPVDFISPSAAGFNGDRIEQQTQPPSAETLRDRI